MFNELPLLQRDDHISSPNISAIQDGDEGMINFINGLSTPVVRVERSQHPVQMSGFSDVYRGRLEGNGMEVALKVLRVAILGAKLKKRLAHEVSVWSRLNHKNVLRFLGVNVEVDAKSIGLVSPWMTYGDVVQFLKAHPQSNRRDLISGVACGLSYLHSKNIVHGDLKGHNILVGSDGAPQLADFGLSIILDDETDGQTSTTFAGTFRWMAPERLAPGIFHMTSRAANSTMSDVYSFGMTIYEILSDLKPFEGLPFFSVMHLVLRGVRPVYPGTEARQRGLDDKLWSYVKSCWLQAAVARPSLDALPAWDTHDPSGVGNLQLTASGEPPRFDIFKNPWVFDVAIPEHNLGVSTGIVETSRDVLVPRLFAPVYNRDQTAGQFGSSRNPWESEQALIGWTEQSRLRRSPSEVFLEDSFPVIGLQEVVKHIGHPSARVRQHAILTLTPFADNSYARRNSADFEALITALLPAALPLLRAGEEDAMGFVSKCLQHPHVNHALAKSGQCPALLQMMSLREPMAIPARAALCDILAGDATCRLFLHTALSPHLSEPDGAVLGFAAYALPQLMEEILLDGRYLSAVAYVTHVSFAIRVAVHEPVRRLIGTSPSIREGLVQNGLILSLHRMLQKDGEDQDIVQFAAAVVPSLAFETCKAVQVPLLLDMLRCKDHSLRSASADALRSLRKAGFDSREALRVALDPLIRSMDVEDEPLHIFVVDNLPHIAADLLSTGNVNCFLGYLQVENTGIRDVIFSAIIALAHDSTELQNLLLQAGLLDKIRRFFMKEELTEGFESFAAHLLPAFAIQICRRGLTKSLVDLIPHSNTGIASAAVTGLQRILYCDEKCRQALLYALKDEIDMPHSKLLEFALLAFPLIAKDVLMGNKPEDILPLLLHDSTALRGSIMPVFLQIMLDHPDQRKQLCRADNWDALWRTLISARPPDDVLRFNSILLPLLAPSLAESGASPQLIDLLANPPFCQIAASCLRKISASGERGQQCLVEANILHKLQLYFSRLQEPIHGLMCELLPVLSILYCRRRQSNLLIELVGANGGEFRRQALAGIRAIVRSSIGDRILLRDSLLHLLGPQEHVLDVVDAALQPLVKDLVSMGEFGRLIQLASHEEARVRQSTYPILQESIHDSASCRKGLVQMGLLRVLVDSCSSSIRDRVDFATSVLPSIGLEACRAGFSSTLMELFKADRPNVREALFISLGRICDGTQADRDALLEADLFKEVASTLHNPCQDTVEFCMEILPKLAMNIGEQPERCAQVLQLLKSDHTLIREAATRCLDVILAFPLSHRRVIRASVLCELDNIVHPTFLRYAAKALSQAFCADLMHDRAFNNLFKLLSHSSQDVRSAVVDHLKTALMDEVTAKRLTYAGIFHAILDLLPSAPPPDIISFAVEHIISAPSPAVVEGQSHYNLLIALLEHTPKEIRQAVASELRRAVDTSSSVRQNLVAADVVARLAAWHEDPLIADLICYMLPKLATELAEAGMCEILLDFLNHQVIPIRAAARFALQNLVATETGKLQLVAPLLERSERLHGHDEKSFFCYALVQLNEAILLLRDEKILLALLRHDDHSVLKSAYDAVKTLLLHGSILNRSILLDTHIFGELLQILNTDTRLRSFAISLILDTLPSLTPLMIQKGCFDQLIRLFGDHDIRVANRLDQTLRDACKDEECRPQLVRQDAISRLLFLLDMRSLKKRAAETIRELVGHLCQVLAIHLMVNDDGDTLVALLFNDEYSLRNAGVAAIHIVSMCDVDSVKSALLFVDRFIAGLSHILRIDRRHHSTIGVVLESIGNFATSSSNNSSIIIASGIVSDVVNICQTLELGIQTSALNAVLQLCSNGDKTAILRTEIIEILTRFLEHPPNSQVAKLALQITLIFAKVVAVCHHVSENSFKSLLTAVVNLLEPDKSDQQGQTNQRYALEICRTIARHSDQERRTLLEAGLIGPLVQLTQHNRSQVVVLACLTIEALASSTAYRPVLIHAKVAKHLKSWSSLTNRPALRAGEDKEAVRKAVKRALSSLEIGLWGRVISNPLQPDERADSSGALTRSVEWLRG